MPAGAGAAGETRVNPGPEAPNAQARGTRGRGSRGVCPGASVPGIQLTRGRSAASRLRAGPLRRVGQEPRGRTRARAQVTPGCASHGLLTPGREPVTAGRRGGEGRGSRAMWRGPRTPFVKGPPTRLGPAAPCSGAEFWRPAGYSPPRRLCRDHRRTCLEGDVPGSKLGAHAGSRGSSC